MTGVRHFAGSALNFTETNVEGAHTTICRAVHAGFNRSLGAGIETLERTRLEWTVT